ncbi:CAF17-like 4Fe-4S cluster assembly/insertion protein YgfZ [Ruania halotolerans]|uniref:CAF17-like 4Fe-4S cluster assembly/insertion protein YgfZ n=1 Tax=Ruania halotolerans TaxID=2897773 RepID=UPI001E2BAC5E|nr:glycine cleavage T C-terminal barrel domain-containing protein [Ruania halotolerans]UFU05920.1 folate-binding protein [Ruania halotolerans]
MNAPSPLLTRPGAVRATGPDEGVAAHYGHPVAEQRALERGIGVVDLSHLGVVTVSGPDRLSWLNTLSSQVLTELAPGASTELLLLDPNGRIEHAAAVLDDGERAWLITEGAAAQPLAAFLDSMRFMLRVDVTHEASIAVLGTSAAGPDLSGLVPAGHAAALTWTDPWPHTPAGSTRYGPEDADHPGSQWHARLTLVAQEAVEGVVSAAESAGARLAGAWAWEAMRVAAWRPRLAREVDERTIPHELDWLRTAVHLNKGCYRGQETIARVFNLGRPPRRLVLLHLDGSEHTTPEPGEEVHSGDRTVGRVTSVVRHHELGPVALALVKRNLASDAPLTVAGIAAAQEVIVSPEGAGTGRPEAAPGPTLRRRNL